jgi:hypothetical protein
MNAQTTETKVSSSRGSGGWKWAVIVLGGLIVLTLICSLSSLWGGLLGFALGRRSAYRTMMYEMPFEVMPDLPQTPDMPEMPYLDERPWLGVTFIMIDEGALITEVIPDSPADDEGLQVDDIITEVEGRTVNDAQPLDVLILSYEPGDRVDLTLLRNGRERTVRVRLASWMEMPWQPEPSPFDGYMPSG